MKKIKVLLSFDDGRKDNYDVVLPILKKYDLKATFNIATAYVDGTIVDVDRPCPNEAMSIENVIELFEGGQEIAAHGDCHKNDIQDIKNGIKKLRNWGVIGERVGFASPNSQLPVGEISKRNNELRELGISYVRIGTRKNDIVSRIQRKIGEKTGNVKLYCNGFGCTPINIDKDFIIYSIPVMHNATVRQVQGVVKKAIIDGSDIILMFHSVLNNNQPHYSDTWTWDKTKFDGVCEWLKHMEVQGKLIVGKTMRG